MRLSWNEVRARAAAFAEDWKNAAYEKGETQKRLFSYPDISGDPEESRHAALSPYLFDASSLLDRHLVVREESAPINVMAQLLTGSQPIDGGRFIFKHGRTRGFLGSGAGGRVLAPPIYRGSRIPARRRPLDLGAARHPARRAGSPAACAETNRRRPRLPAGKRAQIHAQARRHSKPLAGQRHSYRSVSGGSRSQFGTSRIRAYRLAGARR